MSKILELKNIFKNFGDKHVHQGVDVHLNEGESLGLLGGSGTGKSVLLRSIIGLEFVDQGEILFKGQSIKDLDEKENAQMRTQISYSFQSGALFDSQNVFENIAYPLYEHTKLTYSEISEKVAEILKLVELEGSEELMPSDLSGGMQKRIGMARAMVIKPEIVLYDEPTAGLDPTNTKNVVGVMRKFKEMGQSSIFVTHDIPSAIDLCDRVVILNEGKIVFNDNIEKFKNSDDPFVKGFLINQG